MLNMLLNYYNSPTDSKTGFKEVRSRFASTVLAYLEMHESANAPSIFAEYLDTVQYSFVKDLLNVLAIYVCQNVKTNVIASGMKKCCAKKESDYFFLSKILVLLKDEIQQLMRPAESSESSKNNFFKGYDKECEIDYIKTQSGDSAKKPQTSYNRKFTTDNERGNKESGSKTCKTEKKDLSKREFKDYMIGNTREETKLKLIFKDAESGSKRNSKGVKEFFEEDSNESADGIIANILHLLLSLRWEDIYEEDSLDDDSESSPTSSDYNPVIANPSKREFLWKLMKAKKHAADFDSTEEMVLALLFNTESDLERAFGSLVYVALLSHGLSMPEIFYKAEKVVCYDLPNMVDNETVLAKLNTIYKEIVMNIKKFQMEVKERILIDMQKLLSNANFLNWFLSSDDVFQKIMKLLGDDEYLQAQPMKCALEAIIVEFLVGHMKEIKKADVMMNLFKTVASLEFEIYIKIYDKFVMKLMDVNTVQNIAHANIAQFVYFIEDTALQLGKKHQDNTYIKLIAKLVLYLSECKMLYSCYPPLVHSANPHAGNQREGGVIRAIFKVILGLMAYNIKTNCSEKTLILRMLKFFLYGKQITKLKIAKEINIETLLSSVKTETTASNKKKGFVGKDYSQEIEQANSNYIWVPKKPEDFMEEAHHCFRTPVERLMYVFTHLAQLFIYTACGVYSYIDEGLDCYKLPLISDKSEIILSKILSKLAYDLYSGDFTSTEAEKTNKMITEVLGTPAKYQKLPIDCYSGLDMMCNQYSNKALKKLKAFTCAVTVKEESKLTAKKQKKAKQEEWSNHVKRCLKVIMQIGHTRHKYLNKKISLNQCSSEVKELMISKSFIKEHMKVLHKLITEDLLGIEASVQLGLQKNDLRRSFARSFCDLTKAKSRCITAIKRTLEKCKYDKPAASPNYRALQNEERSLVAFSIQCKYKKVLSEGAFRYISKEDRKIFKEASKEYEKLLKRCPLAETQTRKSLMMDSETFLKLDLAKDNLGRQMRFKMLKKPLKNWSVLKGIVYIRRVFLKKVLLRGFITDKEKFKPMQNKCFGKMLRELFKMETCEIRQTIINASDIVLPEISEESIISVSLQYCTKVKFDVDMLYVDHAIFGNLFMTKKAFVFQSVIKDIQDEAYKYGPSSIISSNNKNIEKVWMYKDIVEVIERRYNLIHQAVEMLLRNGRSIFLVIYPINGLNNFFTSLKKFIGENKKIKLIEDSKKEFFLREFTKAWKQNQITSFEYLMKLNHYAGRSYRDLSQYPVFPWIISEYSSIELDKDHDVYRNLSHTIAGITSDKRNYGQMKYQESEDDPGEQFQFGTHYLPGRIVLSYLMRIQPYTLMLCKFDSGIDLPSRCFHSLGSMWHDCKHERDMNYELIPEFFYNPEIFVNL